jgi:RNA polymerase sigma-70 factor (ECF subfamily)
MVNRRCRSLLGNEDDALDATQEVFVKLIEMGNIDIHAPSSLLYVIATRVCLNRLRSKRRKPETVNSELVYEIATHDGLGRTLARDMLHWLFDQNPESSKVIAVLHFCDGLTLQEVADEVGMSVSGVRRRIRVMREQLHTLRSDA